MQKILLSGMKDLIDRFYSDNYAKLKGITQLKISYYGRSLEADIVVSNSYVYLVENIGKFTESEIGNWCVNYIFIEVSGLKSKTNYNKFNKEVDVDVMSLFLSYENTENEIIFEIDNDLFSANLSREDRILWNCYKKGYTTKRDVAKHFDIDASSAYNYIKNIKQKFIDYVSTEE